MAEAYEQNAVKHDPVVQLPLETSKVGKEEDGRNYGKSNKFVLVGLSVSSQQNCSL